jgi:hypothetical protein
VPAHAPADWAVGQALHRRPVIDHGAKATRGKLGKIGLDKLMPDKDVRFELNNLGHDPSRVASRKTAVQRDDLGQRAKEVSRGTRKSLKNLYSTAR